MTKQELMTLFPVETPQGVVNMGRWHAGVIRELQTRLREAREQGGDLSPAVFEVLQDAEAVIGAVLRYRTTWYDDVMCENAACEVGEDFDGVVGVLDKVARVWDSEINKEEEITNGV